MHPLEYVHSPPPVDGMNIDDLRIEVVRLRAREQMYLRRFEQRAEDLRVMRRQGRNADGSMRCPYADIDGCKPCSDHSYSGCGGVVPVHDPEVCDALLAKMARGD